MSYVTASWMGSGTDYIFSYWDNVCTALKTWEPIPDEELSTGYPCELSMLFEEVDCVSKRHL